MGHMNFNEGNEVRFTLRGEDLFVRHECRRWHLRWNGRACAEEHIDHAVAALLREPVGAVMPIVVRLLRSEPGAQLD
jgi:hypothetical protein